MLTISNGLSAAFSPVMAPFVKLPLTGMIVISVLTGVLMLIIYKYTSNQHGITRAKDRIKAHFLAIMLYKDSLGVLLKSIGNILRWNAVYMAHQLRPLAVMIVPVLLLLVQLNFWYGYRPYRVGEEAVINVRVDRSVNLFDTPATMTADEGVQVQTAAVRRPLSGEIAWRVKALTPGEHTLTIDVGGQTAAKRFVVGDAERLVRLAPLRHDGNFWDGLLYPGEKKLAGPISAVNVNYPGVEMNVLGWELHWIIVYFVLSILFGLSMKGIFHVDI
ncbi:MAG TPA: hypothetical protein PK961_00845 [bacterium]|nr:hypothetical protein [bacterium]